MKVAVTGASGFVGRHVVRALHSRGLAAVLVRRQAAPIHWASPRDVVVPLDIADSADGVYDQLGRPDVLIHLAWNGLPNYGSQHHLLTELPIHRSFLDHLIDAGLPTLAVAGTCLEYGLLSGALREDMEPAPVTAYGTAKDALRRHLEARQVDRPFRLTWARLFYVYGEGQAGASLVPSLERAIERGDADFDLSEGQQVRDFLPIEEAARDLVTLALNGHDNGVVNVCSGRPVSVRALVEGIVAQRRSPIRLNFGVHPYPPYEPMAFWGDRSKLERCLGGAR